MANDRDLVRNIKSAEGLLRLFVEIQSNPAQYSDHVEIFAHIATQLECGKLSLPSHDIFPSSMSTIKRIADKYLPGGFKALDNQRKLACSALQNIQHTRTTKEDTKEDLRIKIAGLKLRVQELRQDAFLRDAVIFRLAHFLTVCAKELDSPSRTEFFMTCKKQELYRLGFKGTNIDER